MICSSLKALKTVRIFGPKQFQCNRLTNLIDKGDFKGGRTEACTLLNITRKGTLKGKKLGSKIQKDIRLRL